MWQSTRQILQHDRLLHYTLHRGANPMAYGEFLDACRDDQDFRDFYISLLADSEYLAYRWETPPLTKSTLGRPFEFVLFNAPALEQAADVKSFSRQFDAASDGATVVTFASLGNDAALIAPCPIAPLEIYSHLASFVRRAPSSQVHELWQTVGAEMSSRLGDKPIWLSTAGMGVSWLHIRLDTRPKYYGHAPYRNEV